jgi:hypothetical protein
MNKKGRRRDLMERELLKGAAELFADKGFGGTTLKDIAEKAGVGLRLRRRPHRLRLRPPLLFRSLAGPGARHADDPVVPAHPSW